MIELKSRRNGVLFKGFTLVELIVVIAILVILAAILIPVVSGYVADAQSGVCISDRGVLLRSVQAQNTLRTANGQPTDAVSLVEACKKTYENAEFNGNKISGVCPTGGVYTVMRSVSGDLAVTCDKHPDDINTSKASSQYMDFNQTLKQWMAENGSSIKSEEKGRFFAEYYQTHTAVEMDAAFKQKLNAAGLNRTLLNSTLYWWTYPVNDPSGNLLYTVTFANNQGDTAYWTDTNRGKMNVGYVVIVNGKTYMRTNSGTTVQPANSANPYQTTDELEQVLIDNEYIVAE